MKIITEPKTDVVARQVFIEYPHYPIPADDNDVVVNVGSFDAKHIVINLFCFYNTTQQEMEAVTINQPPYVTA